MSPPPNSLVIHVTQKEIAHRLGLSQATVSKALKNDPRLDAATCNRVQRAARELGYQPNPMGTALAHFKHTSKAKPIEAALAWLNAWPEPRHMRMNRAFDLYWQGATQTAERLGYRLDEFILNEQMLPHRLQRILLTRGIHGLVIPPVPGCAEVNWSEFAWEQFSAVRLGRVVRGLPRFHLVTAAQSANAALSFREIQARGYNRIGFAGCNLTGWTFLGGFLQAQVTSASVSAQLPPCLFPEVFASTALERDRLETKMAEQFVAWFDKWKPDAILTESKFMTSILEKAKLRVPDDIAVASLSVGDLPFDAGIYQNPEEIGRVSALVIISLLANNDRGIPPIQREILVDGTWVDGKSLPWRS